MIRHVLIVGGGPAGWITAGYLAQILGEQLPGGVRITPQVAYTRTINEGYWGLGDASPASPRSVAITSAVPNGEG